MSTLAANEYSAITTISIESDRTKMSRNGSVDRSEDFKTPFRGIVSDNVAQVSHSIISSDQNGINQVKRRNPSVLQSCASLNIFDKKNDKFQKEISDEKKKQSGDKRDRYRAQMTLHTTTYGDFERKLSHENLRIKDDDMFSTEYQIEPQHA